jgi:hypothetical protein
MDRVSETLVLVVTSIIGLAIVAVIVSRRAQTPTVISAAGGALAGVIGAAVSPLGGNTPGGFGGAGPGT